MHALVCIAHVHGVTVLLECVDLALRCHESIVPKSWLLILNVQQTERPPLITHHSLNECCIRV